jgi:hypothetical protein
MYKLESVWVVIVSEKNNIIDIRAFTNYDLANQYFFKLLNTVPKNSWLQMEEIIINSSKKYRCQNF